MLLFGGYIILYTINPALVNVKNPSTPSVTPAAPPTSTPPGGGTPPTGNLPANLQQAAQALQASGVSFSSFGQCGGVTPGQNVSDMANGNYPRVCFCGCSSASTCPVGGSSGSVAISATLLNGLTTLQQQHPGFQINSLTGDAHACGNDAHYNGTGVDIKPQQADKTTWEAYLGYLRSAGISYPYCECGGKLHKSSCSTCFANGTSGQTTSNAHIHAQLSPVSTAID